MCEVLIFVDLESAVQFAALTYAGKKRLFALTSQSNAYYLKKILKKQKG